jgi:charged multivesicular body protein 2A
MGSLLSTPKPLKEIIKDNQRIIKRAIRELDREIKKIRDDEKRLVRDIKKSARENQKSTVKIMINDLVRSRGFANRFTLMKTQLNALSLRMQTMKSNETMTTAMKDMTKILTSINKQSSLPELQKVMNDFMSENEKNEFQQEVMNEGIDDIMADQDDENEQETIYNQIMDELGLNFGDELPQAPISTQINANGSQSEELKASRGTPLSLSTTQMSPGGTNGNTGNDTTNSTINQLNDDQSISELTERLNNLRR